MQTQTVYQTNSHEGLLRNTLRGNAIFSVISGLVFAFAAGPAANFMGLPSPIILIAIGLGLLPFAYMVHRIATGSPLNAAGAKTIIALDAIWVVGSYLVLLLAWASLTVGGRWFVALQAEAVFLFALFQMIGVRRVR